MGAILLGSSGRGDKSFTDAALAGLDAARKHGRLAVVERLPPRADEYGATIDQLAADGPDLMIGVGFLYADPFRAASARHPRMRFLRLDVELPNLPNVKSVTFRADEGSFLAGVAAGAESKCAAVGFIGGMNMPTIQAFECGFETGVRFAAKQADRTVKGYTAAGASGLGVIKAARQAKVKVIGADGRRGSFRGGVTVMNLANGGVDLVLPGRLAPATQKPVERARAAVVAGHRAACVKQEAREPAWHLPPRSAPRQGPGGPLLAHVDFQAAGATTAAAPGA